MKKRYVKILSPIIVLLMLIPILGVNINTHICGETQNTLNSIVIPGILEAEECNKCHKVVVVKSCCNKDKPNKAPRINYKKNKTGCCKDFLTYNSYDYLIPHKTIADNSITPILNQLITFQILSLNNWLDSTVNYKRVRLRPYQPNILSLFCSLLI